MLKAEVPFTHNGRYYAKGEEVPEKVLEPDERANYLSMGKIIDTDAKRPAPESKKEPKAPATGDPAERGKTK